jgi:hypothetical protein
MVISIVVLAFNERKKIIATIIARHSPNHKLSDTLLIEVFTKSACT